MNTSKKLILLILTLILFIGCKKKESKPDDIVVEEPEPIIETSVETLPPNTNYKSAFAGQTRIRSVKTNTAIQATAITSSLASPWGVASLPDGRLLVTEKVGRMRIVTTTGTVGNIITGIPAVNSSGQGGLLGLCLDPQFPTNRMVYWVFSENVTGGSLTAVAKGKLSSDETSIENATVIYRAGPAANSSAHFGGRILFDQTGNLVVSCGERANNNTRVLAQSVAGSLGKIVRINTNGLPASGNPTFTQSGALPELYSFGHRNPQGIAFHPVTKELWQSEHGPRGGDEINLVKPGANYGWPTITYGLEYSGQRVLTGIQQQTGMEQPAYYWDPVVSPSGMTFYSGNRVPEWQNNLFVGSLSGMHIVRLVIENNKITGEERLLRSESQRFRDITQGIDGALYAITDAGRLYRIDRQ